MLAALALKPVLFHVVGKIRKLGSRLRFDPFPCEEAGSQSTDEGNEAQEDVEQTKGNSKSDSKKYRGQGNPKVIDIDCTKTQNFSKQACGRRDHGEFLGVLAFALRA